MQIIDDTLETQLVDAAQRGDAAALAALLDAHPDALHLSTKPFGGTLLHTGARHPEIVSLLLARGMDANAREGGDNTYAMHWAAAAGSVESVRRLIAAGGDVIGEGDDHELAVIGWATCWYGCDDEAHRAVVELLLQHGARHHIFSAVAMGLESEVRRIVAAVPGALGQRMSRNEDHQQPLHFAVRMQRPRMVDLLVELGADPLGTDASGQTAVAYALTPDVDRPILHAILRTTRAELDSARRGHRSPDVRVTDLLAALALHEWETAATLWNSCHPEPAATFPGVLHLVAKRGDVEALEWLIARGSDVDALWSHWGCVLTPLHLAILGNHPETLQQLLNAGADTSIRDSQFDATALEWAEHFGHDAILELLD